MASFLVYGRPAEVRRDFTAIIHPMTHWTCGEPKRIFPGDVAWIVTAFGGRLTVVAPLTVGDIVSLEKARARCGRPHKFFVPAEHMTEEYIRHLKKALGDKATDAGIRAEKSRGGIEVKAPGYEPYGKPHHMFVAKGKEKFSKFLDITTHAAALRFHSPGGKDRLKVGKNRSLEPQQLRPMRKLTDTSAGLLQKIWDEAGPGLREIPDIARSRKTRKSAPALARKKPLMQKPDEDELRRLNQQYAKANATHKQRVVESVERGRAGEAMKKHRDYKCQVCEATEMNPVGFKTKRDVPYAEAHHVEAVGKGGSLGLENIIVLCANHHRQMHSGNVELIWKAAGEFVFRIDGKRVAVARYSP